MNRRDFLDVGAKAALLAASASVTGAETESRSSRWEWGGIEELLQGLKAGRVSSRRLTALLSGRIRALDDGPRGLRAVTTLNPDAEARARVCDRERREGMAVAGGALHGIPILVKDNLDTGDRQPTTAGSLALAGTPALRDAFVVRRLREAGAILLGKTNLSEWANFRSTRSSSGWSGVRGQTRNPHVLGRNPSGSSSGSGAAVSAGYAPAAIGTETDGSIVSPACHNALVGLKPTIGLVSRSGIVPISRSQDTAGPMTRTVRDAAILLGVIAGPDPADPATTEPGAEGKAIRDYTRFLDRDGLRGVRLGVMRQAFGRHREVLAVMDRVLESLRGLGAILVDPVTIPTWGRFDDGEGTVLDCEFKTGIAEYLSTREGTVPVRTLADLIEFNRREARREMPFFGQEIFERSEATGGIGDRRYAEARELGRRLAGPEGVDAAMSEHRLDALIAPTEQAPAWSIDLANGDRYSGGCSSLPAVAGYPHLTVPAGYVHGLPVGLSFIGRAWSEGALLRFGYAFEQATRARREPRFLDEVEA